MWTKSRDAFLTRPVETAVSPFAKRLECGRLAGAFMGTNEREGGSELHALQTLREVWKQSAGAFGE